MARSFARRRRKFIKKVKSMKIPQKILKATLVVAGFVLAVFLGVAAGRLFGMKVVVDASSMSPAIEENAAVRVNKLIYKLSKPKRMDIIVFNMGKNDTSRYYVRRVIGLPGEKIQIVDGVIYVDDQPITFKYNTEYIENAGIASSQIILDDDEYFVIGDNYNSCEDSRFGAIGNIEKEQIIGKAG